MKISPDMVPSQIGDLNHPGGAALYRFYDSSGSLLYVGVTGRPLERWAGHRRTAVWWKDVASLEWDWHHDMWWALRAEREAIVTLNPLHNKRSAVASA